MGEKPSIVPLQPEEKGNLPYHARLRPMMLSQDDLRRRPPPPPPRTSPRTGAQLAFVSSNNRDSMIEDRVLAAANPYGFFQPIVEQNRNNENGKHSLLARATSASPPVETEEDGDNASPTEEWFSEV